jgi:hypothetical protein
MHLKIKKTILKMIITKNNKNNNIKNFKRYYRKSSKSDLILDNNLIEIIYGNILGDLHVERRNLNCNARLQFKYSTINSIYLNHLYDLFKNYCGKPPIILTRFDERPNKNKEYFSIKFQTFNLPCFNQFREKFYNINGKKIIPLDIENLLTAKSLSYWLMDDGYNSKEGFYFCTESYSLEENELLVNVLNNKFNLKSSIHKVTNGYRLYISKKSKDKLVELVRPNLLPLFYYKLNISI